jgi:hypothetical protein
MKKCKHVVIRWNPLSIGGLVCACTNIEVKRDYPDLRGNNDPIPIYNPMVCQLCDHFETVTNN